MQNQPTPKKRGRPVLWDARLAFTALAVGGTIGFWNLFSTQMVKEHAAAVQPVDPTPIVTTQVVEINLPPLPTLVPPVGEQNALAGTIVNTQMRANVPAPSAPSFQPGTKLLLGGSSPQAPRLQVQTRRAARTVVTTTRSSH